MLKIAMVVAFVLGTAGFDSPVVAAEPEPAARSTAIIGLRGGFDSNPTSIVGAKGSPFATDYATWDYMSGSATDGFGFNLQLAETQYDPRLLASGRAHALTLKQGFSIGPATALQGSITTATDQSWSRRRNSVAARGRMDHAFGALRLFASAEARLTALNERNVFALGDFLPRDENFGTLSATPGIAWRIGPSDQGQPQAEIGVSLTAARVHSLDGVDYLGLRRDHTRLQPNLFASATFGPLTLEGSLSPFRALFPEKDFEPVKSVLYTAKARWSQGAFSIELGSGRTIEDTTLPFSVINLVTAHEAKAVYAIDAGQALSLSVRRKRDDYRGLGARSDQDSIGLDYQRTLAPGLAGTVSGQLRETRETGLPPVRAFSLSLGLQKQLDLAAPPAPKS